MSTAGPACFFALAIEPGLQLLDRGAGQHQSLVVEDVVDVGAHRRQQVDLAQVRRSMGEADVDRVAVDHQRRLAEAELAELLLQRRGLRLVEVEAVEHDQLAVLRLGGERHAEAERAHFLVERRIELAGAGAVRLAAADEDRRAAVAVTGGAAALLLAELLAGAVDFAALAGGAGRRPALLELPGDDAVQDVGARLDAEHGIVELDVGGLGLGVQALNLDLHDNQPSLLSSSAGVSPSGGFASASASAAASSAAWASASATAAATSSAP